jgi:hypothetical protein
MWIKILFAIIRYNHCTCHSNSSDIGLQLWQNVADIRSKCIKLFNLPVSTILNLLVKVSKICGLCYYDNDICIFMLRKLNSIFAHYFLLSDEWSIFEWTCHRKQNLHLPGKAPSGRQVFGCMGRRRASGTALTCNSVQKGTQFNTESYSCPSNRQKG